MRPTMGPCTVTASGYILEREVFEHAKLTSLGTPPNAIVKMYQWVKDQTFVEFDVLNDVSWTTGKDERITIEGWSSKMVNELNITPEEAHVTWIIECRGCEGC